MPTELKFGQNERERELEEIKDKANIWVKGQAQKHFDRMKNSAEKDHVQSEFFGSEMRKWLGETLALCWALGYIDGQKPEAKKKTRILNKDGEAF